MSKLEWYEAWKEVKNLIREGVFDEAILKLRAILPLVLEEGDFRHALRHAELITWLYIQKEQYYQALSEFQNAENLITTHDLTLTASDNYNHEMNRALLEMQFNSFEHAVHSLNLCYKIAESTNKFGMKIRALRHLSILELMRGETVNAINAATKIINLAKSNSQVRKRFVEEIITANLVLGYFCQSKGDVEGFHQYFHNAITLLPEIKDITVLMALTKIWIYIFIWNEKTMKTLSTLLEHLLPKINDNTPLTNDFCLLIAYYYLKQGNVEHYRNWSTLGSQIDERFLTPYHQARLLFLQSQILLHDGFSGKNRHERIQEAMKRLEQSRDIAITLGFTFQQVLSGLGLASLHLESNQISSAIRMVQEVMELARLRQWWPLALKSEALLIELLILDEQYTEAKKRIRKLKTILPFKPELMSFVNLTLLENNLAMALKLNAIDLSLQEIEASRELKITEIQSYIQECISLIAE